MWYCKFTFVYPNHPVCKGCTAFCKKKRNEMIDKIDKLKKENKKIMEKTYKRVQFNIELSKKIQSGEVEGKIVEVTTKKSTYNRHGCIEIYSHTDTFIELPEETPKHEFKPFEWVLVRASNLDKWKANLFSHMDDGYYKCVNSRYAQCIPYEGNEHLVGTTDNFQ